MVGNFAFDLKRLSLSQADVIAGEARVWRLLKGRLLEVAKDTLVVIFSFIKYDKAGLVLCHGEVVGGMRRGLSAEAEECSEY